MPSQVFLAVDLGASSGRVVAGRLDGGRLHLDEVHRFANGPVRVGTRLHWDLLGLWTNILDGMRAAAAKYGGQIVSIGVDTWGVDYGLLAAGDELLGNPYHYRDQRTEGMFDVAFATVPRDDIFAHTGLQFMELNTLYQLLAAKRENSPTLAAAEHLLLMPDLFHWLLTGDKVIEKTNASTTQLYDPRTGDWSNELIESFGLPRRIFGTIVPPGTCLGSLQSHVAAETKLSGVDVVLPGTHDTASAVYAVPVDSTQQAAGSGGQPNWAYLSSGTWSLMGLELPEPLINSAVAAGNFTNEAGVGETTRLLKNIGGLWLVQECRRIWQREGNDYSWQDLTEQAAAANTNAVIDPNSPELVAPDNMPRTVAELCQAAGQPVPATPGETVRCCLNSLAACYRDVHGQLEDLVRHKVDTIHVVGGGSQNELLNQLTADATGCAVVAGPIEATAIGNVMVQAQAAGVVADHAEARELIRQSFPTKTFLPA